MQKKNLKKRILILTRNFRQTVLHHVRSFHSNSTFRCMKCSRKTKACCRSSRNAGKKFQFNCMNTNDNKNHRLHHIHSLTYLWKLKSKFYKMANDIFVRYFQCCLVTKENVPDRKKKKIRKSLEYHRQIYEYVNQLMEKKIREFFVESLFVQSRPHSTEEFCPFNERIRNENFMYFAYRIWHQLSTIWR